MINRDQGKQEKTYGVEWGKTHTTDPKTGIIYSQLMIAYEET